MLDRCLVVEFEVSDDDCPLAEATAAVDATIHCRPPLDRDDGTTLLHFTARGDTEALAATLDADPRIAYLHVAEGGEGTNYRCLSKRPCIVRTLVDTGFLAESLKYSDGRGTFTGGVVGHDVLHDVLDEVRSVGNVDLRRIYPLDSTEDDVVVQKWNVTPRQEEAIRVALEMNYLDVPRQVTASEVAASIGISKSAFLARLRRGQLAILSQVFDSGREAPA